MFLHLSVLSFPLCVGAAAVAPTLFRGRLDPRWYGAVIPTQLVLLTLVPLVTSYVTTALLLALDRQNWEAGIPTAQSVGIVIAVAAAAPFGLVATAAVVTMSLAMLPLPLLVLRRQCGLSLRDALLPQALAFVASCLMGAAVLLLRAWLEDALKSTTALFILIAAGATFYAILNRVMGLPIKSMFPTDVIVGRLTASLRARRALRRLGFEWLLYHNHRRYFVRTAQRYRQHGNTTEVLSKLRNMNLVFTVTAGRSGTMFAHNLFSFLPNVTSEHEPAPAFHTYLRRINKDPAFAEEFLLSYKLPLIASLHTQNYVELSHAFCKGFLEPLLELAIRPNLILLRRDPRLIALSYLERYTVPERTFYGIEFLLSPRYARTLPLSGWRRMTDYQLIFWYALEIERRQREYSRLVRSCGGIVCDVTAMELHDFRCFVELAQTLCLLGPAANQEALACHHAAICRIGWNKNDGPLWHYEGDLDREEEEVWRAVSLADPQLRSWVEERYHRTLNTASVSYP